MQDSLGGDFERQQSFSGAVGAIDIWDYILSPNEIQKYSECEDGNDRRCISNNQIMLK